MRIDSALHNSQFPDLEVRQIEGKGRGVFSRNLIPSMTLVCVGRPTEILPNRTEHSFQVGWNHHVELDEPARLINHGCDFNLTIRSNEFGGYSFLALRDISSGEELCWHYGMTEATSIAVSQCCCGSGFCQGRSVGFTELSQVEQSKLHRSGIAEYLSSWYLKHIRELGISRI